MNIINYIERSASGHNKKILIVSDQKKGQALLKKYSANEGGQIRNICCQTLKMMLNAIYLYFMADSTCVMAEKLLNDSEANMIFRDILIKNIDKLEYFTNQDMMDTTTSKEIFDKVNLVRLNGWNGKEDDTNPRISDLKKLVDFYEEHLVESRMLDAARMYRVVLEKLHDMANAVDEVELIVGAKCSYLKEDSEYLSGLEKKFLMSIVDEDDVVELPTNIDKWADSITDDKKCESNIFKGFGIFNEANYVAYDILSNKLRFGDVEILYSSSTQLPAIASALRGNGIPMSVVSTYQVGSNDHLDLALRILAWADEDFDEVSLERILASNAIKCKNQEDANPKNLLQGYGYYDYIKYASRRMVLGWGYERNLKFVENERLTYNSDSDNKARINIHLIDMHEKMVKIFGEDKKYENVTPITVFDKLVMFIKNYTHTYNSNSYKMALGVFDSIRNLVLAETRELPLEQVVSFIADIINTASCSDKELSNAVKVRSIGAWGVLDRANVYVTGLTLKDMQGNTAESPVLTDDELNDYLKDGYKPTVIAENARIDCNLKRSISTFDGARIAFGYSSYDIVEFCENNPSSFLREVMEKLNVSPDSITEFVYGNPTSGKLGSTAAAGDSDYAIDYSAISSSTSMENIFLKCPHMYAYSKIHKIPDIEYKKRDVSRWLEAKDRGILFHAIAENYIKTHMIGKSTFDASDVIDEAEVERIAKEEEEKLLVVVPADSREIADMETQALIKGACEFLSKLNTEFAETGYKPIMVEEKFHDFIYEITDFSGNTHEFKFNGCIDRIDYRVNKETRSITLRIGDYKTGKISSKKAELKYGKLMQYVVYGEALMSHNVLTKVKNEIARVEGISDIDNWAAPELLDFRYEFPYDDSADNKFLPIMKTEFDGVNITRLKLVLSLIKDKHIYPTSQDLFDSIDEYVAINPNEEDRLLALKKALTGIKNALCAAEKKDNCEYCGYKSLCAEGKAL